MALSMEDNPEVKVSPDGDLEVKVSPDGDLEKKVSLDGEPEVRFTLKGEEHYRSNCDKFERDFARALKAFEIILSDFDEARSDIKYLRNYESRTKTAYCKVVKASEDLKSFCHVRTQKTVK